MNGLPSISQMPIAEWLKSANVVTSGPGQVVVTLIQDEEFRQALSKMIDSHQGQNLLIDQLVLLAAIYIFRTWRISKCTSWGGRLFTQFWIAFVYWMGALLVVPCVVWGEAYRTVLSHGLRAIFHVIFA